MRLVSLAGPIVAALLAGAGGDDPRAARQPVPFDHRLHDDNHIPCATCHPAGTSGEGAGLPGMRTCLRCHEEVLHSTPALARLRELGLPGRRAEWVPTLALRADVYFTHRRHTDLDREPCDTCHTAAQLRASRAAWAAPRQDSRTRMDACTDCHRRGRNARAGTDCVDCHR